MDDLNKDIDEAWKKAVEDEKAKGGEGAAERALPEVDFAIFLSGLMLDCLVALGDVENPMTHKTETNLGHAKYVIDIVTLIKEKTEGNLTDDEAQLIEQMLYQLRMKYIAKTK